MSDQKPDTEKYGPRITTNHALSGKSSPGLLIVFAALLAALVIYSLFN